MSKTHMLRRSLLALSLTLAVASPAVSQIPRQDPARCRGQVEIRPLEPLQVVTARGTTRFMVELADSPIEREYGLMCRKSLAADRGMLFDFGHAQELAFWMRNTLIPLDIIYIRADGTVLSIASNAQPLDETPLPSLGPARAVLELPAGRAAQLGLLPGDRIIHRIFPRG